MTINTAAQTHHSHTNNTTDYVKPMTSLAVSQSPTLKTPSEQHSKLMQKPPNPAPKLPRQPLSVFAGYMAHLGSNDYPCGVVSMGARGH